MKTKVITLLNEIKDICEGEQIPFFISEGLMQLGMSIDNINELQCYGDAAIMVFAHDIERLISKISQKENRYVESLINNKNFPGYYLRYMDLETTYLDSYDKERFYNNNCIGVDIEIICGDKTNSIKEKSLVKLKKAWARIHRRNQYIGKKDISLIEKIKIKVIKIFFRIIGNELIMQVLFDKWTDMGKNGGNYNVVLSNGMFASFKSGFFDKHELIEINECPLPIISQKKIFYDKINYRGGDNDSIIVSKDLSWNDYAVVLRKMGIDIKKYYKINKKYMIWRKKYYWEYKKQRSYYYNLMFCTGERIEFSRKYTKEKKRYIYDCYNKRDYIKVKSLIDDYLYSINKYLKHNIGFCFDIRIFEIAVHIMLLDNKKESNSFNEFKKKNEKIFLLVDSVPTAHFDNIELSLINKREKKEVLERKKQLLYDKVKKIEYDIWEEKNIYSIIM